MGSWSDRVGSVLRGKTKSDIIGGKKGVRLVAGCTFMQCTVSRWAFLLLPCCAAERCAEDGELNGEKYVWGDHSKMG